MKNRRSRENGTQNKILTIPNVLSFFRLCLIPLLIWLYCVKQDFILAGYVLLLSGVTDIADGFIARRFHMISDFGKVLDPIADKLTQGTMLFCLFTRFHWMLVPLALMLVKELYMGISGVLVIKRTGTVFGANWHGKVATCLLYAMMIVHIVYYDISALASNLLIASSVVMMVVSMILYGIRNTKALKEGK